MTTAVEVTVQASEAALLSIASVSEALIIFRQEVKVTERQLLNGGSKKLRAIIIARRKQI